MKKETKIILLVIFASVIITVIDLVSGINKLDDIKNDVIVYNQQEYHQLENWSAYTDDFSEVSAFIGSAEEYTQSNSKVKLINNSDDMFILADMHGYKILYCKKNTKIKTSYDPKDIISAEIIVDGKYTALSENMREKLFGYIKNYNHELYTMGQEPEYQVITSIRVTYAQYPFVVHNIGIIANYQNNVIFIPSGQERNMLFGDEFIPIPFDPIPAAKGETE